MEVSWHKCVVTLMMLVLSKIAFTLMTEYCLIVPFESQWQTWHPTLLWTQLTDKNIIKKHIVRIWCLISSWDGHMCVCEICHQAVNKWLMVHHQLFCLPLVNTVCITTVFSFSRSEYLCLGVRLWKVDATEYLKCIMEMFRSLFIVSFLGCLWNACDKQNSSKVL